ncbi:MAG: hypothetical protein LBQ35_01495, partial [Spirochaetaceae bacterium]|nr:hypothetical protein [Spirochaetaceae bacterium]
GIYPIGSTVKLNDDSIARVTEVKAASPLTPVVRVLIDGKGRVAQNNEGALIDLLETKGLYIVQALNGSSR